MSYTPTEWKTGDVITAERLNKAEQGIKDAHDNAADISSEISTEVASWLDEHVNITEGVNIDDTLSVAGSAADAKATGDELNDLRSEIRDIEAGTLPADSALDGQIPMADGDGGWEWETPDFIRAADSQGQPIVIPEIDDTTTSADNVWSSQKTSTEISAKYTKPSGGIPASDLAAGIATVTETVSGTAVTIAGEGNHRYICGEVATIAITPPASGVIDIFFESGSTAAVLTLPQGNSIIWPSWFDPTALMANATYEINIVNATFGAVAVWI